jgi:hypothetical protein
MELKQIWWEGVTWINLAICCGHSNKPNFSRKGWKFFRSMDLVS